MNIKHNLRAVYNLLTSSNHRFKFLAKRGFFNKMNDEEYLRRLFKAIMGYEPDLSNPKTFSEKLQWLKINDRRPIYTTMVDKYEVKKYVADIIGEKYIIPTIGVWDRPEDIDFDSLPNRFVLKTTHDSHGLVICKNKKRLNKKKAVKLLQSALKKNYYYMYREWPYKNVKPRIIAEEYMEDSVNKELWDYKFFCFDGEVKAMYIASERSSKTEETKFDFYDSDFNHLPFKNGHPNSKRKLPKPKGFNEMKEISKRLSKDLTHVRVDFYEVDGRVYFGELTFYHWSGMMRYEPEDWDYKFGEWLKLPI